MTLGSIAVRAAVAYIYLLAMTRASGKSVVSQATPFDFLVGLILGDVIDDAVWADVSMAKFAGAAGSIMLCDALTKIGASRWLPFFHLVNGRSGVLVRDGREDRDELRRQQLTRGDLAHLLRQKGVTDWNDVHLALIERGHELSVILRPGKEPATKEDAGRVRELAR
ncbi:MAG: DUF421 domain-containing protein [Acidobacteriota bacterium]|nr:DUF421 domain-containing protein [Acidobacteriota bacterium]